MLTKKVNMFVGYIGILRTIHDCRDIAEIKNLKTIRVGQKTQKYRKNRTPILPPEITILKNRAQCIVTDGSSYCGQPSSYGS